VCSEPINNKELTSFSLRDFLETFSLVVFHFATLYPSLFPQSYEFLNYRKFRFEKLSFSFFEAVLENQRVTSEENENFQMNFIEGEWQILPVAAKLSHHQQHIRMRCFSNPRQLNSVAMVDGRAEEGMR
jgi:hypothetical protein